MNRIAVVTGGSRGIGRGVAERLARDGCTVAIVHLENDSAAASVVRCIADGGGSALAIRADVADEVAVERAFDQVERTCGGIDVVAHAAAVMTPGTIVSLDLDDLDRVIRTNVRGTFVVAQQSARRVREGGAIINFSSSATRLGAPSLSAYVASKAAVESISLALARELRGRDVTVNAIAPSPTATDMFFQEKDAALIDQITRMAPSERLGTVEDIAEVVSLLAGRGRWINGQTLYVNGGLA